MNNFVSKEAFVMIKPLFIDLLNNLSKPCNGEILKNFNLAVNFSVILFAPSSSLTSLLR